MLVLGWSISFGTGEMVRFLLLNWKDIGFVIVVFLVGVIKKVWGPVCFVVVGVDNVLVVSNKCV